MERSRTQIRAARTDLAVTMGLIFEQIRAVRTEFAETIERIVANQGGMDIFFGASWPLFGQIRAVERDFVVFACGNWSGAEGKSGRYGQI